MNLFSMKFLIKLDFNRKCFISMLKSGPNLTIRDTGVLAEGYQGCQLPNCHITKYILGILIIPI